MNSQEWYRNVYLQSEHWRYLRLLVLGRAKHKCWLCRYKSIHNDVHHLYYGDIDSNDTSGLIVLCRKCHDLFHNHSDFEYYVKGTMARDDMTMAKKRDKIRRDGRRRVAQGRKQLVKRIRNKYRGNRCKDRNDAMRRVSTLISYRSIRGDKSGKMAKEIAQLTKDYYLIRTERI